MKLLGWTDCWLSNYEHSELTEEKREALVQCIRHRHYNFTYQTHQNLPFSAPYFEDNTTCSLTNTQWNSVMDDAYADTSRGLRLAPADAIKRAPINDILYEKKEYEPKGGEVNG